MNLTDLQIEALLFLGLGIVVSVGTSLLKTINVSPKVSQTIAGGLSVLAGYSSSYFARNGISDLEDIAKHSTYIYTASQLVYAYALQSTALNAWLIKFNLLPTKK